MSPLPPAIGAASAGLRYQVRFFWLQALPMLYSSHVSKVVVEHREFDAVDDVVVYYTPPGINDGGALVDVDFTQLKFHVAESGVVDQDAIVDPDWTGTKRSLLKRFSDAWLGIRATHPKARLNLVTNWPWDSASPIRPHLRDGGYLDDDFFTKSPTSEVGEIRAKWQAACGLVDLDFHAFLKSLRFSTSAVSQAAAEEWLRDRCQLAGLMPVAPGIDWSPYDDLGKRLIENGRTEHTPESLGRLVRDQGLIRQAPPPFQSTLAVRSFRRFAQVPFTDGMCVVDLTDLFNGRRAINETVWSDDIPQRIEETMPGIEKLARPVHIALDAHLSIAWYIGSRFNPKSGIPVVLRQKMKDKPVQLWDVSTPRRPDGSPEWDVTVEEVSENPDLAVVVSVTHDSLEDAKRSISTTLPEVGTILHLRLPNAGPASIADGGHARWLADALIRTVRNAVVKLRPEHTHIFPATPVSLMFLAGQEAAAIGPTIIYEFAFGDPARSYLPGMTTESE